MNFAKNERDWWGLFIFGGMADGAIPIEYSA